MTSAPNIAATLLLVSLGACSPTWSTSEDNGFRVLMAAPDIAGHGGQRFRVMVEPDEVAFQLTAITEATNTAFIHRVQAPDGREVFRASDWWEADRTRTNAGFSSSVPTLNWPITEADGPLQRGRWVIDVQAESGDTPLPTEVTLKRDPDLTSGDLSVMIHIAADLQGNPSFLAGLDVAIQGWRDIYWAAGITLSVDTTIYTGPAILAPPLFGDEDFYDTLSATTPRGVVNVVVASAFEATAGIYGISGGIPGPVTASRKSAVAISALEAMGADGALSAIDTRILSETLAHEVGHYLGLFHPVETTFDLFDDLDDTPECASESGCTASLGTNMMYPTPTCLSNPCTSDRLLSQDETTPHQRGVMHRFVGVR
ncbi:MAG: hypothetical protein ACON5B_11860 [Myxococcota bacterium]